MIPEPPDYAKLLRKILRAERGLKGYEPSPRRVPAEPAGADWILAALADRHRPGDAVGLRQIAEVAGVSREVAASVRTWAKAVGAWSYIDCPSGFALASRKPRRKGGGE